MQLHARVLRYARPEWRALVAVLALSAAAGVLAPLQPWPLKLLVDHAIGTRPPPAWLAGALDALGIAPGRPALLAVAAAAGIAVFALHATLDAVLTLAWARASQRMVLRLAGELFLQLQRLSLTFHARRPLGDSLSRLTTDAWCVQTVADGLVVVPLRQGMVLLATGVLAWQLDPGLTGLVLVGVPVLAASAMHFGRRLQHAERRKRESGARLAAFVHQVVGAMPLVQSFAAGPRNRRLYDALARESVQAARHGTLVGSAFTLVNGMATTLGIALVVYAGGLKVLDHAMALGSLLVFVAYVRTLDQATRALLKAYGSLRGAAAVAQRVTEVLDAPERVPEPAVPQPLPDRRAGCTGQLRFEGIVAGHVAGQPVLHGADLVVAPGETVALVGGSGAGKTTLVSLVPRFLDPWSGRVLLDGVDVRALALADLRAEVGVVLQDPFLLPISIADNIAYGRPDARREAIVEAARAADAHDFIAALPQGYDTVLGEQGGALSGGQRQRLAIARALLRDPRVLILDEPTSALDAGTERQVMDGLARLAAGRTTLIVAHRLATVRLADRIAVLDAGRVVEVGTHAELLARGGRYAQLHALGAGDALREAVA